MTYFIFGSIRPDMLVQDLKKPCEVMGYISKEVAEITGLPEGLPVIASGADKACETLAVGCDGPDVAAISMGTAASIEITTENTWSRNRICRRIRRFIRTNIIRKSLFSAVTG